MGSEEGRGAQTDKTPAAMSFYRSIFFHDGILLWVLVSLTNSSIVNP